MNILVIRLSALGDVAMTLPVVYSAALQHPDVQFTVLTRPFFARLFINRPSNVAVMEADYKGRHKGMGGTLALLHELSTKGFTHVADLHNVSRSWQIDTAMRLHGCQVAMVDKNRRARRSVMNGGKAQKAYIQRYVDVFSRLGLEVGLSFTSLFPVAPPCPTELKHPAVGIAPFARYANKAYPADMMQQVVDLLGEHGINVYLFGARGQEAEQLAQWHNATSLAGKLPIEQELAVMHHLDVMVAMDSANQHLAALTGTRVMTIWGSTTPACGFTAYGQKAEDNIVAALPCQPCTIAGSDRCKRGDMACFKSVSPQQVAERLTQLL